MSNPAGVVRVVVTGHLGSSERWSFGYYIPKVVTSQADAQTLANQTGDGLITSTFGADLKNLLRPADGIDKVTVYCYPTGGTAATFVAERAEAAPGVGTGQLPFQSSLVATLLTGSAGRSHRGRIYLPATGLVLADSQAQATFVNNLATDLATWLGAGASNQGGAVVVSQKLAQAQTITSLRVDSRIDTQRRRAASQKATTTATHAVTTS